MKGLILIRLVHTCTQICVSRQRNALFMNYLYQNLFSQVIVIDWVFSLLGSLKICISLNTYRVGEIQKADLSRRIVVNNNGMVLWLFPAQLESTCVTRNENGEHVCRLKFGSWTYNGLQLNLTHSDNQLGMSNYYPNPDWEITSTNSLRNVMKYACCPEPYPDISYQLSFKGAMKGQINTHRTWAKPFFITLKYQTKSVN